MLLIIGVKINVTAVAVTMLLYSIYGNIVNAGPLKKEIDYTYREQLKDFQKQNSLLMGGKIVCWESFFIKKEKIFREEYSNEKL